MRWQWLGFILLLLVLAPVAVAARDLQRGDNCTIAADETVVGNLFVLCRALTVEGHVTGNLMGAATDIRLDGAVDGDVYLVGWALDVSGQVGDDVHFAGPVARLHPPARLASQTSSLLTLTLSTAIQPDVTVPGSVIGAGYQLLLNGTVEDEVQFWGSALTIAGTVGSDVNAQVGDADVDIAQLQTVLSLFTDIVLTNPGLRVRDGAQIDGQLTYAGPTAGVIAPGSLAHPPSYTPVVVQPDFSQLAGEEEAGLSLYLSQVVREFIALAVIGVLGLLVVPRGLQAPLQTLRARALPSLAVGLLTFISLLIVIGVALILTGLIIFLIARLGINELTFTIAAILGIVDIGGSGLLIFVSIFVSRVVVSLALGQLLMHLLRRQPIRSFGVFVHLGVGGLVLALLVALPIFGLLMNGIAVFFGLGAILLTLQSRMDAARSATNAPRYVAVTAPALPRHPDEPKPPPPPPPIMDDEPRALGMDNLPDGFEWWDD